MTTEDRHGGRDLNSLRDRALALLARREHSRSELSRKLRERDFERDDVAEVLDVLESQGSLSDERFAHDYVRSRISRGFGPLRIADELRERGVDAAIIRDVASASEEEWIERAAAVCRKRFGDTPITDLKHKARQVRFLAQRGFTQSQCHRALGSLDEDR